MQLGNFTDFQVCQLPLQNDKLAGSCIVYIDNLTGHLSDGGKIRLEQDEISDA